MPESFKHFGSPDDVRAYTDRQLVNRLAEICTDFHDTCEEAKRSGLVVTAELGGAAVLPDDPTDKRRSHWLYVSVVRPIIPDDDSADD